MQVKEIEAVRNRVSNDARNAMHAILGFLEVISEGNLSEMQRTQLALCRGAADRLLRVLSNADSCMETGPRPAGRLEALQISSLIEAMVDVYGVLARSKGLQMHCRMDEGSAREIWASPDALEQIIGHLLDNAIKFTASGQVDVRVETPSSERLRLVIADTGCGVPDQVIDQLRTAGGCICAGEQAEQGIAGFGLTLASRRVAQLGGYFELRNLDGGGCEAIVELPTDAQPAFAPRAAPPAPRARPEWPASGDRLLNLLVSEDSQDSYALLEVFLQSEGHTLARAWNGRQAVEMAQAKKYDLVLMDVHMPLLDGYAAAREIRTWETLNGLPRVPIVVLSADRLETQTRKGAMAGCSGYLEKPVSREMLLRVVNTFRGADMA